MPRDFIGRLLKIDLHAHLEGSLPRATLAALAARHGLRVPPLRRFDGFHGFLKAFGAVCDLLRDEADFDLAAAGLFDAARRRRVAHVEVLFSPQVFMRRGVPLGSILRGLTRARGRAVSGGGFSAVFILDGVRQWGGEWLDRVVAEAAPWAGAGLAGVGVGGDESAIPAKAFVPAFRRARALGLGATIHAGEGAGPRSVEEALDALRPDRIGHGVRAVEDPALVRRLASAGVTLEVCPTSNLATGVVRSIRSHPARALMDAGAAVTINSDDGAFFGTDVERELRVVSRDLGFTREEILRVTLHAARAAFLPPARRARLARSILASAGRSVPELLLRGNRRQPAAGGRADLSEYLG